MIDFKLSTEQRARQAMAREFAERHIAPIAASVDRDQQFPWEVIERGILAGLTTMMIPAAYGGGGFDHLSVGLVLEELGAACAGMASIFGAALLGSAPIVLLGTEDQKQRLLRRIAEDDSGRYLCAFAVTEAAAGSGAASGDPQFGVQLRARRQGDSYILSGSKRFISNGGVARLYSVLARTHPTKPALSGLSFFAVAASDRLHIGKVEAKMGQCACPTTELIFDDVAVPACDLLGREGIGGIGLAETASFSGPLVSAICVGVARAAVSLARQHARRGDSPLLDQQGVAMRLFDMATTLEAARHLVWRALWENDQRVNPTTGALRGAPNLRLAAMAKVYASDACVRLVDDAVEIIGLEALVGGHPASKLVRDAKLMQIFDGTNQIHRIGTARLL
jgi:alkylation response protein AidB-like acyl-CoA dehydrogenase